MTLLNWAQLFAIVIAGCWVYWKFVHQREPEPATDIEVDLRFVGTQEEKWIIEVTCLLENKSLVRHTYRDFQVTIRYLEADDKVEDGDEKIRYQLKVKKTIDQRLLKNAPGDKDPKKRFFAGVDSATENQNQNQNQNYMNPKQSFRHRYITWVPLKATFVWVQCKFVFDLGRGRTQKVNSQKIFRVPGEAEI